VQSGAYFMDFYTTPDAVYDNLTGPGTTCDADSTYRVCVNDYAYQSYLIAKPLLDYPANHPNASFSSTAEPAVQLLKNWMDQGAPRYATPPPPPGPYTLEGVMALAATTGCTSCHGYAAGAAVAGGMPLDGCRQDYIDGGQYEAAGVETDPGVNPNYKQDCVYYHLKNQTVADDPYGYNYRVNPGNPEASMLLRNPYCGPDYCAADPQYSEQHPLRVFPSQDDARYVNIRSWIEAGALNNYDP
jgi:hypothetical protein